MRVLLVGPEREANLSLRYLASSLTAAGHHPELVTFDSLADLPAVLRRAERAEAVGLSLCFQVRAREFLTLAAALKLHAPRTPIVAGGHYASCVASELLAHHPDIDVIVLHEGEHTLVELADVRFAPDRLAGIAGIVYRAEGVVRRTAARPAVVDLDSLPHPDRSGPVRRLAGVRTAYVMGSRGCFSSCEYCCIVTLHKLAPGPRFRQRSVQNVVEETAALYHDRGVRQFVFHDDNFLVPSSARNHERLDALAAGWAARGVRDIGFTIKCRPGEADRGVFEKLARMGLLRVFLGIESASAAGLCSIGRKQDVAASEAALELCRELGISAQYTLMCFHPDATLETVAADLDFFRRHITHALNFCRVETYAGTPIEARLRAAGRGRGDYLARTYTIADPVVEIASRLAMRVFYERCWATESLMEVAIGLDHLAGVLCHFHRGPGLKEARAKVAGWTRRVNKDLIALLERLLRIAAETQGFSDPELVRRTRALVAEERSHRAALLAEGQALREHVRALGIAASERRAAAAAPRRTVQRLVHVAAALALATAVAGCGGVSEYAPPPLADSDDDGLPDDCERQIFGTDPDLADTDADGTRDGDENHDSGSMSNREEQAEAGQFACLDAADLMSEYAPPPLADSDNDGLPDDCERQIFGTDPTRSDSDADGIRDGDENHDAGSMTNLEEQDAAGRYACLDAMDLVDEAAPGPLPDSDGDGLPDDCERQIFGTDPDLADTDGNGTPDGDENHDYGTMTNAEEQTVAGPDACLDSFDLMSEYAPPPLDSDADGLPDDCERQIFGTDPGLADSDADGVPDGAEDHDGGGLTNAEEQAIASQSACVDVEDP